jgi:sugar phosphate isomerase/epimerase
MKRSLSTQAFLKLRISEEVFKVISELGFRRCELWAMQNHLDYKEKKLIKNLKAWSEKYSVSCETAHLPLWAQDKSGNTFKVSLGSKELSQKSKDEFLFCIDNLYSIGVQTFVLHVGEDLDTFYENFYDVYRKTDCRFAIENDPMGFPLSQDVVKIVDFLRRELKDGESRVGACLDIGHANIWEKPPENVIKNLSHRIIATHISDNDGTADTHLIPKKGNMDWSKIVQAFFDIKYQENFTYEIAPFSEDINEIKSHLSQLTNLSDEFRLGY